MWYKADNGGKVKNSYTDLSFDNYHTRNKLFPKVWNDGRLA